MISFLNLYNVVRALAILGRTGTAGLWIAGLLVLGFGHALAQVASPLPFPDAHVLETRELNDDIQTLVMTSPVSEVGSRLRYDTALEIAADGWQRLIEVPPRYTADGVMQHYRTLLQERNAQILFACDGRECGRSNVWANRVFDYAQLSGRDGEQAYIAGAWHDEKNHLKLLSVYVVLRGNRTVGVLEQLLSLPEGYLLPGSNPRERQVLGPFVIPFQPGAVPELDLDTKTRADIEALVERYPEAVLYLSGFAPATAAGPEAAMTQAEQALELTRTLLTRSGVPAERQVLLPIGAAVPIAEPGRQGYRVEVTLVRQEVADDR